MKDAKENLWNMAMGIVICMVIAKSVHIHSVLTFPYPPACVINMALKETVQQERMHKQYRQERGLHQSWYKALLQYDWLWKGVVSARNVQTSLHRMMLVGAIDNWYAPCWSSYHYHGHHQFNHIQGVWQPSYAVDVNMDVSLQHYERSHWPSFGKSPRNQGNSWATNDGEVQWLKL